MKEGLTNFVMNENSFHEICGKISKWKIATAITCRNNKGCWYLTNKDLIDFYKHIEKEIKSGKKFGRELTGTSYGKGTHNLLKNYLTEKELI